MGVTARTPHYIVAPLSVPNDAMRSAVIARLPRLLKFPAVTGGTFGPSADKCRRAIQGPTILLVLALRRPYGACHLPGCTFRLRGWAQGRT